MMRLETYGWTGTGAVPFLAGAGPMGTMLGLAGW
jgi:hypothetical protein